MSPIGSTRPCMRRAVVAEVSSVMIATLHSECVCHPYYEQPGRDPTLSTGRSRAGGLSPAQRAERSRTDVVGRGPLAFSRVMTAPGPHGKCGEPAGPDYLRRTLGLRLPAPS